MYIIRNRYMHFDIDIDVYFFWNERLVQNLNVIIQNLY